MHELWHSVWHALSHSLKELLFTVPFLFLAYLLMEFIEHRASKKMENSIAKIGRCGPVLGTGLGLITQPVLSLRVRLLPFLFPHPMRQFLFFYQSQAWQEKFGSFCLLKSCLV